MAELLRQANEAGQSVTLGGAYTKAGMAGAPVVADVNLSSSAMKRILQYEPRDLTISVEAGVKYSELKPLLAQEQQMLPLDPPFSAEATMGGIVAANTCGPRRRLYGTARDMVIGMSFATLEGKIVKSGGMVVKNVAGLDMSKLLIGSFGTLAAITSINFKLAPLPESSLTFVLTSTDCKTAFEKRDQILRSVLQPSAIDVANPEASARLGLYQWSLLVRAAGSSTVLARYRRELADFEALDGEKERKLWSRIEDFTADYIQGGEQAAVVKLSTTLGYLKDAMQALSSPAIARAGNGICYAYFDTCAKATGWANEHKEHARSVIEFAPKEAKAKLDLWPGQVSDFEVMRNLKAMFDPKNLLNKGRFYGRI